ncbi:Fur family transcriptional regulator [Variovorax paradoxus]|uniref:Fur family transcriptional regulator n=1 Tax=Variovorax paradoxus TaxID=34073 RepID=UPI00325AC504
MLTALSDSRRSLTPQEICEFAQRSVPRLSLSTVYRQLKSLLEDGEIVGVDLPGQATRYEALCESDHGEPDHHHHHFHCGDCGRVFPIHGCPGRMEDLAPKGFLVQRHDLTLHGRCADCAGTHSRAGSSPGSRHRRQPTSKGARPKDQKTAGR